MKTLITARITLFLLAAFCAVSLANAAETPAASSAQSKVALIDLRKVFDDYYKTKTADATLKDRGTDLEKERKALVDQGQKVTDDYRKALDGANDQAVSSEEREKRKKTAESKLLELKELEQNLAQFDRQSNTTLAEQRRHMRENILAEIKAVIANLAKKGSYTMVIDTAAETINQTPVLIYTNGENDITSVVLAELNRNAPPSSPSASRDK
jgi:outer membrane protein